MSDEDEVKARPKLVWLGTDPDGVTHEIIPVPPIIASGGYRIGCGTERGLRVADEGASMNCAVCTIERERREARRRLHAERRARGEIPYGPQRIGRDLRL